MKFRNKAIAIALLFVALVLLNFLACNLPFRWDFTSGRIYTLSAGSRALLAKIDEPITLDFYFSRDNTAVPIEQKDYADRVEITLRQFVRAAHGKITLHVLDPEPDTPQEDQATRDGIQPQRMQAGSDPFYFGLAATQADKSKAVPALTPDREQFLEYDIAELIYNVQQVDKKKLGLITSLPLMGAEGNPMAGQQGTDPQYVISEWQDSFDIVPVDATATELPSHLDALAVVHPENLTPQLQFAIDQFLLAGKPVFMAVDPSSYYFKQQGGQAAMFGGPTPNVSSDLPVLLGGWGIPFNPQKVLGDNTAGLETQSQDGSMARNPVDLSLTPEDFDHEAQATAQLNSIWFIQAGSIALAPGSDLRFIPLIWTSAQAGELDASALQFSAGDDLGRQITPSGRKTIAALIVGKFPTAFPDGAPKAEPSTADAGPAPKASAPAPWIKESTGKSTLLLVADTDWLLDFASVQKMNVMGTTDAQPLNDNLTFAANALDYLAGSDDLLSIRGKGATLRPFMVVDAMKNKANEKYQTELAALEDQLNTIQSKITELQGKQTDGKELVATPEVAKDIQEFQAQAAKLKARRRELNFALNRDIDALKYRLLAINLLVVPLLLCVFGVFYNRFRRR